VTARTAAIAALAAASLVSACAVVPPGPLVQVMPGPNKPYEQFQADDGFCRGTAQNAVAGQVEAVNNQAVGSVLFGAILGTALGAAVGGGRGAAIGAAAGAGAGSLYGVNGSQWGQLSIQQRYDIVYAQCMASRGNRVPGYGPYRGPPPGMYPPPPPGMYPPPPPGMYPPPPPGQ
jgi:uncharacterized protein YcfJ